MFLMGLWTMNAAARLRLFGIRHAFDEPGCGADPGPARAGTDHLSAGHPGPDLLGRLSPELKKDLWQRYYSWLAMIPAIAVPIVLGAFWTILAVCVLSLFCFREFARATGFFREKLMNVLVVLGIIMLSLASVDHWYRLFMVLYTHRHRRNRGRLDLAGSAQGLHPAGGDGEPQLPFLRHLSGAHRLHGQR